MKKLIIYLFIIFLGTICSIRVEAQTHDYNYSYDACGNRINRNVVTLKQTTEDTTSPVPPPKEGDKLTETLGELTITVSPNPTRGEVNVAIHNLPEGARVESALYNSFGMLLSASPLSGTGSGAINLTAQPSGIYYLKLKAGDKRSVWKIIKE